MQRDHSSTSCATHMEIRTCFPIQIIVKGSAFMAISSSAFNSNYDTNLITRIIPHFIRRNDNADCDLNKLIRYKRDILIVMRTEPVSQRMSQVNLLVYYKIHQSFQRPGNIFRPLPSCGKNKTTQNMGKNTAYKTTTMKK